MPGLSDQKPYKERVQGGLPENNFINAKFATLSAGPPRLADIGGGFDTASARTNLVYPIGLAQNFAWSQNQAVAKFYEIGSERSYVVTGRSMGQISFSRILLNGPSLLRVLYAYYEAPKPDDGGVEIESLFTNPGSQSPYNFPLVPQGLPIPADTGVSSAQIDNSLHKVHIPPGYENFFCNLQSDLFSQPVGLMVTYRDNNENMYANVYFESCMIPSYSTGMDAQGTIIQESVSIMYDRAVPIPGTYIKTLDGILRDVQGSKSW